MWFCVQDFSVVGEMYVASVQSGAEQLLLLTFVRTLLTWPWPIPSQTKYEITCRHNTSHAAKENLENDREFIDRMTPIATITIIYCIECDVPMAFNSSRHIWIHSIDFVHSQIHSRTTDSMQERLSATRTKIGDIKFHHRENTAWVPNTDCWRTRRRYIFYRMTHISVSPNRITSYWISYAAFGSICQKYEYIYFSAGTVSPYVRKRKVYRAV